MTSGTMFQDLRQENKYNSHDLKTQSCLGVAEITVTLISSNDCFHGNRNT